MIRITGGEFRGRLLETPKGRATRPSHAQLRQALFNSIQDRVHGARCVDLFSGPGTLLFEALSRGASSGVAVENNRAAMQALLKNRAALGCDTRVEVLSQSVDRSWKALVEKGPWDLILADPPYRMNWAPRLLKEAPWESLLVPSGLFIMEWCEEGEEGLPDQVGTLVKIRQKNYGESVLTHYEKGHIPGVV